MSTVILSYTPECILSLVDKYIVPYWTAENVFNVSFTFFWLMFLWETYLSYRQYAKCVNTPRPPSDLAAIMDPQDFSKARLYRIDKARFGFFSDIWGQTLTTIILWYNLIPLFWNYCGSLMERYGYNQQNEITRTAIFMVLYSVISTVISFPLGLYSTFVIEERHGFNKQTLRFYCFDQLKKFIVMQIIMLPIICGLIQIIKIGGDYFFVFVWLFVLVVSIILITIYPDFIAPLFDKFTELPQGSLRQRIEDMASSLKFPLTKLYVVDGSKRSAHSNAYFYGFFNNKRIVLFDTLIEDYNPINKESDSAAGSQNDSTSGKSKDESKRKQGCNDDEVLAVLGHELGHWYHGHVYKMFLISQVNIFVSFVVFAVLYKNPVVYEAFGFYGQAPIIAGLVIIFSFIFSPFNTLESFVMTWLTRVHEFQADRFARSMHMASHLRSALIKLNLDNLGFPVDDWLYSAWNHSHPPLLERIEALGKHD